MTNQDKTEFDRQGTVAKMITDNHNTLDVRGNLQCDLRFDRLIAKINLYLEEVRKGIKFYTKSDLEMAMRHADAFFDVSCNIVKMQLIFFALQQGFFLDKSKGKRSVGKHKIRRKNHARRPV